MIKSNNEKQFTETEDKDKVSG